MRADGINFKHRDGPTQAKYQTWWVWLWGVVALGLIALLFLLPFVWWALAALVMFGTMEGIGLAVGGAYPPLTEVIARYVPRWLAFALIFALVGAAGATWYHVKHPIRIAALVGLLGWFTAHFDVTFDTNASAGERAKYRRIANGIRSRFRRSGARNRKAEEMTLHRFAFTHHATQDHSSYVHAIEDMDEEQQKRISEEFEQLDREALQEHKKVSENGTKPRLPGVIDQGVDDELRLGDAPPEDRSRRIWAILKNVEGAGGGISELAIADVPAAERIMDVLRSKKIKNYTYPVSKRLIRGSRPSPQKLADLFHHNGVKSTINLCREMHHGDDEIVAQAGLTDRIRTLHIPLVDNGVPSPSQVLQFFNYLSDPDNVPAYVHCEQGIGRTCVMVGCYRMAFNGWAADVAESEAKRFDNGMPMQLEFIVNFPTVLGGNNVNLWTPPLAVIRFPLAVPESPTAPPNPDISRDKCLDPSMSELAPAMGG